MATIASGDWATQEHWQGSHTSAGTSIVTLKEAIKQGADVNEIDEETGRTALMHAAAYTWDLEIIPHLISLGADVRLADKLGKGVLHHAAANNTAAATSIAIACCSAGADPAVKDAAGSMTPYWGLKPLTSRSA